MKKVLLGILLGFVLAFSASAYADDIKTEVKSLIGQQVQGTFPIKLQNSQLESDAIVVDNTSYLPVRTIGELLNLQVSFIDNEVLLEAKDASAVNAEKLKEYEKKVAEDKQAKWEKDKAAADAEKKAYEDQMKAEKDAFDEQTRKSLEERDRILQEIERGRQPQPQEHPN